MTDKQLSRIKMDTKKLHDTRNYHRTKMQKDIIIQGLKDMGCRITKQRLLIIDIILQNECSCCKEIYYKASGIDPSIGVATVYRLVNTLEEIGAISRKNMYKIMYSDKCNMKNACTVVLDDDTVFQLSAKKWNAVMKAGLSACGYVTASQNISSVTINGCECEGEDC